jgi:hypothetical protein
MAISRNCTKLHVQQQQKKFRLLIIKHIPFFTQHQIKVSDEFHVPAALPQGKSSRFPLDKRLGEHRNWSERYTEEKTLH